MTGRAVGHAMRSAAALIAVWSVAGPAHAWEPLQQPNPHVERGNERLDAGDAEGALSAYDEAARELPSRPGVHLNRGLALIKAGKLGKARQSLLRATEPPASKSMRAKAYYNLGLAFYREADKAASSKKHDKAQKLFREAADSFRRSLRAEPGNRDAGWNLELAQRRIKEQEKKAQQKKKKQAKNDKNKKDQNQQNQDQQQQQNEQNQDQQNQQNQDQQQRANNQQQQNQQQNQQNQNRQQRQDGSQQQKKKQAKNKQQRQQGQQGDRQQQRQQQQQQSQQQQQQRQQQRQRAQAQDKAPKRGKRQLPPNMARILDALENQEESLQQHRARTQGRHRREPEKDW